MARETVLTDYAMDSIVTMVGEMLDNGYLRIYDENDTMGCELRFSSFPWGAVSNGTIKTTLIEDDPSAMNSIQASRCRCFMRDGETEILSGTVGVKDSPKKGDRYNVELNSTYIQKFAKVSVASFSYTVGGVP